eukprot:Nk52_evm5s352 gene=Nk52_evmTU5s352
MTTIPNVGERDVVSELQFLKKKYTLLEGERNAYFDISSKRIGQNRELINSIQEENRNILLQIKTINNLVPEKYFDETNVGTAEQKLIDRNFLLRKQLDDIKNEKRKKLNEIWRLNDELQIAQKDAKSLEKSLIPTKTDIEIRKLYNRKEKTEMQLQEALNVKRTYDALIEHFNAIAREFNNKTEAFDIALKKSNMELDRLREMGTDSAMARDTALKDLEVIEDGIGTSRRVWEKKLESLRYELKQQEEEKQEVAPLKGSELERRVEEEIIMGSEEQLYKSLESMELIEKLDMIKEALGAPEKADIDEVLDKIALQNETSSHLEKLKEQYHNQIDNLNDELQTLKKSFEEYKCKGTNDDSIFVKNVSDEVSERNEKMEEKLQFQKEECSKAKDLLVRLKIGTLHLTEKLELHMPQYNEKVEELNPASYESLASYISIIERKLVDLVNANEQYAQEQVEDEEEVTKESKAKQVSEQPPLPEYNNRITFIATDKKNASQGMDRDMYDHDDADDDVCLSREAMKKRSQLLVDFKRKKGFGKGRRRGRKF